MDCFFNGLTGRIVVPNDSEYDELMIQITVSLDM